MTDNTVFSIGDLAQLKQIIEVASSRGAFKAEELTTIGLVYDRLAAFVNAAGQKVKESTETTQEDE